jgi:hypothetical protein
MVSCTKVCSVAIDLRSVYGSTGLLSMPLAFFQISTPFYQSCNTSAAFGQRLYRSNSNARQRLKVTSPTIGIFLNRKRI